METIFRVAFWSDVVLGLAFAWRAQMGIAGDDVGERLRNSTRLFWRGPFAPRECFTEAGWRARNRALACAAVAAALLVAAGVFLD